MPFPLQLPLKPRSPALLFTRWQQWAGGVMEYSPAQTEGLEVLALWQAWLAATMKKP